MGSVSWTGLGNAQQVNRAQFRLCVWSVSREDWHRGLQTEEGSPSLPGNTVDRDSMDGVKQGSKKELGGSSEELQSLG